MEGIPQAERFQGVTVARAGSPRGTSAQRGLGPSLLTCGGPDAAGRLLTVLRFLGVPAPLYNYVHHLLPRLYL